MLPLPELDNLKIYITLLYLSYAKINPILALKIAGMNLVRKLAMYLWEYK